MVCATPGVSPLTGSLTIFILEMLVRAALKRSTFRRRIVQAVKTMGGMSWKERIVMIHRVGAIKAGKFCQ